MIHEQIITDLSLKCARDVSDRLRMSALLVDSPSDRMVIAFGATAQALGAAAAFHEQTVKAAGRNGTPAEIVDAMWSLLRPMVLKTMGGGDADFRALIASLSDRSASPQPPRRPKDYAGFGMDEPEEA